MASQAYNEFSGVTGSISKAADMMDEIAHASEEQARGVDQINRAVADMDKVTQRNAANAEESASVCEELSDRAKHMEQMVRELVSMVGGANGANGEQKSPARKRAEKKNEIRAGVAGGFGGKFKRNGDDRPELTYEYHREELNGADEHESTF